MSDTWIMKTQRVRRLGILTILFVAVLGLAACTPEQEEIYVLISGTALIKVDDEEIELEALDAIRLAPEAMRALRAGPDGCELIAFGAPKPPEQDTEMVPGWWSEPNGA